MVVSSRRLVVDVGADVAHALAVKLLRPIAMPLLRERQAPSAFQSFVHPASLLAPRPFRCNVEIIF
jgi:hypothetical protein